MVHFVGELKVEKNADNKRTTFQNDNIGCFYRPFDAMKTPT